MAQESLFMLYALLMGIFITFVYDLLRILRRVIPHNIFWVSLEDLAFWGFSAVEVFLLMYHVSNGTLRWFAIFGTVFVVTIYMFIASRFVLAVVQYLLIHLRKIVALIKKGLTKFLKMSIIKVMAKKQRKDY